MKPSSVKAVLDALDAELKRSMHGLKAPGHPRPYYISYLFREVQGFSAEAKYGALYRRGHRHRRTLYTDVRVGSYRFDQLTHGGLHDNNTDDESYDFITLPIEDGAEALRYAIWRLTDARYREAVSAYHQRKSESISVLDENQALPSFSRGAPRESLPQPKPYAADEAYWSDYLREASKIVKAHPEIKAHRTSFAQRLQTNIFVDSEGNRLLWQTERFSLEFGLWRLLSSGEDIDLGRVYHSVSKDEMPDLKIFKRHIKERLALIEALAGAERMTSYSGPVLLAPVPAGLLLHEVLGHRLEGSRLLSNEEGRTFKDKVGQQVTTPSLSIYDDPSVPEHRGKTLLGAYDFDDEGTPSTRAELVTRGVLKGFLTTRAPLSKRGHASNGHARSDRYERPISRMGSLFIEPHDGKTPAELKALLIAEIKRRGLPYGVILLEAEGGETGTDAYDFQAFLGQITVAKKVFPDGSERFIRGVDFVGTPLTSLSHILAVGDTVEVDNGFCGAESGMIPVSTISPALLLSSLELQAKDQQRVTQFLLPLPWE
jgi:TldD protein